MVTGRLAIGHRSAWDVELARMVSGATKSSRQNVTLYFDPLRGVLLHEPDYLPRSGQAPRLDRAKELAHLLVVLRDGLNHQFGRRLGRCGAGDQPCGSSPSRPGSCETSAVGTRRARTWRRLRRSSSRRQRPPRALSGGLAAPGHFEAVPAQHFRQPRPLRLIEPDQRRANLAPAGIVGDEPDHRL